MVKVVLISCVSKKLDKKAEAQDLYISSLFKKNLNYAKSLKPNKIFILSAKYGLLNLNDKVAPYNKTLNKMNRIEREKWAKGITAKLRVLTNLKKDKFIFLAGKKYREYLTKEIKNYEIPTEGLSIGKQLNWLSNKIK